MAVHEPRIVAATKSYGVWSGAGLERLDGGRFGLLEVPPIGAGAGDNARLSDGDSQ